MKLQIPVASISVHWSRNASSGREFIFYLKITVRHGTVKIECLSILVQADFFPQQSSFLQGAVRWYCNREAAGTVPRQGKRPQGRSARSAQAAEKIFTGHWR